LLGKELISSIISGGTASSVLEDCSLYNGGTSTELLDGVDLYSGGTSKRIKQY
jgi:hypothetical protein